LCMIEYRFPTFTAGSKKENRLAQDS